MVAEIFKINGYAIVDADKIAKEVTEKGSKTLKQLSLCFGEDIINDDGSLNRALLSKRAFNDKCESEKLNAITHPAILAKVKEKIAYYKLDGYEKIIYDAPLLFESGSDKLCDKVLCVIAPKSVRMDRVKKRDNMNEAEIIKRMNAQHNDEYYISKSDYVIINDCEKTELLDKVNSVIKKIDEV